MMRKKTSVRRSNEKKDVHVTFYEGSSVLIRHRGQTRARVASRRDGQNGEASRLVSADRRVDEVYYAPASLKSHFPRCVVLAETKAQRTLLRLRIVRIALSALRGSRRRRLPVQTGSGDFLRRSRFSRHFLPEKRCPHGILEKMAAGTVPDTSEKGFGEKRGMES